MTNFDADELRIKAHQLFTDELAREISAALPPTPAVPNAPQRIPFGMKPQSVGTLFFGNALYNSLGTGKFEGDIVVKWNGPDEFIFEPDPDEPFAYITAAGDRIEPRRMDTDGGSIPVLIRGLKKYSPWGYAPAFIIHDWIFTAHKCGVQPDDKWSFTQAADIMAEAIKTLMEDGYLNVDGLTIKVPKAEDTLLLMHLAVKTPLAKGRWDDIGSVVCRR